MSITEILFWVLSVLALVSAIMVVASKNPVHSILFLIVVFFTISGHYILLNAQFLAIVNIIVYAGAIMVLFLFVVMLMNLNAESEPKKNRLLQFAGLISGGCLFLVLISAIAKSTTANNVMQLGSGNSGLIKNLGMVLFNDYVIPFEISSVLFLSAMIGAVVIGKKEKAAQDGN
ncbi:MAG: NADH-quinone oxidoreductase subunit J [Chitinophagaceae bacterium]|nr:NADH-quinone oxidoreductase subunit J [Chitinophagaceae bacterium]